jgi:hypothetical protein
MKAEERDDHHVGELQLAKLLLPAQPALEIALPVGGEEEGQEQDHLAADPLPDIVKHRLSKHGDIDGGREVQRDALRRTWRRAGHFQASRVRPDVAALQQFGRRPPDNEVL